MEGEGFLPEGIKLFDAREILSGAAHYLFDHLRHIGISDHANRGGGPQLDRALYDADGNYHDRMALDTKLYQSYIENF